MKRNLAAILVIIGLLLGLYIGIYLGMYYGIVGIVKAVEVHPIAAGKLAWSIIRLILLPFVGATVILLFLGLSELIREWRK